MKRICYGPLRAKGSKQKDRGGWGGAEEGGKEQVYLAIRVSTFQRSLRNQVILTICAVFFIMLFFKHISVKNKFAKIDISVFIEIVRKWFFEYLDTLVNGLLNAW